MRERGGERRKLTLAVLLSPSRSHTLFYSHFIHTILLAVLQASTETDNSVSVCGKCAGFYLEGDAIFTDLLSICRT